ncbi:MAG: transcription termination factor NusA [Prochlorothrix sp.]|nr:transcription termination factor NusA [Prochlorothrix sp.]
MTMVSLPNLQTMVEAISEQKKLPIAVVEAALKEALLKGYERYRRTQHMGSHFDEEYFENFEVELDVEGEGFRVLATKSIVESVDSTDHQIALKEVQEVAPEAQLGDTVVLDVTPEKDDFGRMAAIQTKQVLSQKLRDHQRRLIQEEFQDLEDPVLSAKVLRFERQSVILAVSSGFGRPEVESELPRREQLPNDNYRANSTFKVFLKEVADVPRRGPQVIVSRANAGLVVYLFENEVPEIQDGIVRIVAVAREANPPSRHVGPRTKIAVDTLEKDVDPVGACIGARGSRIQVVVNELRGEKIDVIRWSLDPATYIANALSPARVEMIHLVNPESRQAHVLVREDQLSLAIGKDGQNVRLAAKLTGWKIDIKDVDKYDLTPEDWVAQGLAPMPSTEAEDDLEDVEAAEALADSDAIDPEMDPATETETETETETVAEAVDPIEDDLGQDLQDTTAAAVDPDLEDGGGSIAPDDVDSDDPDADDPDAENAETEALEAGPPSIDDDLDEASDTGSSPEPSV